MTGQEREVLFLLENMTTDIKSLKSYSLIPFHGEPNSLTFAMLKNISGTKRGWNNRVVEVRYNFDEEQGIVFREERSPQNYAETEIVQRDIMAKDISKMNFEYQDQRFDTPRRIHITIEFMGHFGKRSLTKYILVPAARIPIER